MPTSPAKRQQVAERRSKALRLRTSGLSYEQIASQVGLKSAAAACMDVLRATRDRKAFLDQEAALFVVLECERLDTIQRSMETALRQATSSGNLKDQVAVADRLLRVAQRRAALLGLDGDGSGRKPEAGDVLDEIEAKRVERARRNRDVG